MNPSSRALPTSLTSVMWRSRGSLEGEGALDVRAQVHDLLPHRGVEGVGDYLFGKVVACHGEDELALLCCAGDAEDGACEEGWAADEASRVVLELSGCGGVGLTSEGDS